MDFYLCLLKQRFFFIQAALSTENSFFKKPTRYCSEIFDIHSISSRVINKTDIGTLDCLILMKAILPVIQKQLSLTHRACSEQKCKTHLNKHLLPLGYMVVPAGGGGTFLGGYIVKKLNLRCRGIIRFCMLCALVSLVAVFVFLLNCPNMPMAGVITPYQSSSKNISSFYTQLQSR